MNNKEEQIISNFKKEVLEILGHAQRTHSYFNINRKLLSSVASNSIDLRSLVDTDLSYEMYRIDYQYIFSLSSANEITLFDTSEYKYEFENCIEYRRKIYNSDIKGLETTVVRTEPKKSSLKIDV
jgi:hypothetical protein